MNVNSKAIFKRLRDCANELTYELIGQQRRFGTLLDGDIKVGDIAIPESVAWQHNKKAVNHALKRFQEAFEIADALFQTAEDRAYDKLSN